MMIISAPVALLIIVVNQFLLLNHFLLYSIEKIIMDITENAKITKASPRKNIWYVLWPNSLSINWGKNAKKNITTLGFEILDRSP